MTLPSSTLTTLTTFGVVPNLHEPWVREVDLLGRSIQPGTLDAKIVVLYGFISDVGFEVFNFRSSKPASDMTGAKLTDPRCHAGISLSLY